MIKIIFKIGASALAVVLLWVLFSATHALAFVREDMMKKDVVITAHRGGAGYDLENSLRCIKRSLEAGIGSVEIDVQLSSDGYVVVCHDVSVDRTTNGEGHIADMTLAQLRQLRLVDANGNVTEEQLPLLSEVLELIDGKAHLLLEIKRYKGSGEALECAVVEELRRYDAEEWTTVQSFNDEVISTIHSLNPVLRLEKLAFFKVAGLPLIFDGGFRCINAPLYDIVESFNFFYGGVSQSAVEQFHQAGKHVRVWTVNKLKHTPKSDVDGIITDYPDLFINKQ